MVKGLESQGKNPPQGWLDRGVEIPSSEVPKAVWEKIGDRVRSRVRVNQPVVYDGIKKQPLGPGVDEYIVWYSTSDKVEYGIISIEVRDGVVGRAIIRGSSDGAE